MTKKNKKKAKVALTQLGGGLKAVALAAATHPVTAALFVMSLAAAGQAITHIISKRNEEGQLGHKAIETRHQLKGLYEGAQALGVASAVVPVVVTGLGVAKTALEAYATRAVEVETGYP